MKKSLILLLVAAMLCLSGCSFFMRGEGLLDTGLPLFGGGEEAAPDEEIMTLPPEAPVQEAEPVLPLPEDGIDFVFSSGAGAWSTVISVNRDGSFAGDFHDSEMGDVGEGYPQGTLYHCAFSGRFENVEQLDEYSYKMTLVDFTLSQTPGTEWIDEGFRHVVSDPYGMTAGMGSEIAVEYIFYLPNTPTASVPEYLLSWWPYRFEVSGENATLMSFAIMNTSTYDGFFSPMQ